jgi:hypothetical protein
MSIRMTRLQTIGDLIDSRHGLYIYCEASRGGLRCGHYVEADLESIAGRLGRDHSWLAADLVPRLRCSKCGSKDVSIRLSPPTVRDMKTGELR